MTVNIAAFGGQAADPAGTAASLLSAHVAANDPHASRTTLPIDSRTGAQTLAATDRGHVLTSTDATAQTYTVPANVFGAGDVVYIRQGGAGQVTLSAGASMVLDGTVRSTAQQGAAISVHFQSATEAWIDGNAT